MSKPVDLMAALKDSLDRAKAQRMERDDRFVQIAPGVWQPTLAHQRRVCPDGHDPALATGLCTRCGFDTMGFYDEDDR